MARTARRQLYLPLDSLRGDLVGVAVDYPHLKLEPVPRRGPVNTDVRWSCASFQEGAAHKAAVSEASEVRNNLTKTEHSDKKCAVRFVTKHKQSSEQPRAQADLMMDNGPRKTISRCQDLDAVHAQFFILVCNPQSQVQAWRTTCVSSRSPGAPACSPDRTVLGEKEHYVNTQAGIKLRH